jgi:acetyl esterase/lipase
MLTRTPSHVKRSNYRFRYSRIAAIAVTLFGLAAASLSANTPVEAAPVAPPDQPAPVLNAPNDTGACLYGYHVIECKDIRFGTVWTSVGWHDLYMNIYLPTYHPGPDALLIYIPGGGWVTGGRENCPGELVANQGYAMACIEYRHSDQALFPAQIQDVKLAVRWLHANANAYGIDPARFGAWGDSAGGHLAALLGTSGGVPGLEGADEGYAAYSSRVQAVVDWFGLTDFTQVEPAFEQQISWPIPDQFYQDYGQRPWYVYTVATTLLLGGPVSEHLDLAHQANPIAWIDPADPPFFIMHGEIDTIVPVAQSQILADALAANRVPVTLVRDSWRWHSPSDPGGDGYGPVTLEQALAFFDTVLHGRW